MLAEHGGFVPLTRDGLVDRVAKTLVDAILSGRIPPGARLAESQIARQMDLSRGGNFSGLVVFIVFLVLIGAVLAATTFIFYKRSQVPGMSAMPDTYEQL